MDYGVGNLHSLVSGLRAAGIDASVEADLSRAVEADALVLPGVGAFPAAASRLAPVREALRDRLTSGLPCLAICLGMQLLLDRSMEGVGEGIGLVTGTVDRLAGRRVPHMGWSPIDGTDHCLTNDGLRMAYFAHGFACRPRDTSCVTGWATHDGERFPAAIRQGRTIGVQFHPEKSSRAGIAFLRAAWEDITA